MARVYRAKGTRGWSIDYECPLTGKRVREVAASTKRGAEQVLAQRLVGAFNTPRSAQTQKTLGDLEALWKAHKALKSSLQADVTRWRWIIRYFTAEKPLADVTLSEGVAFQHWLTEQPIERKRNGVEVKLTVASVNRITELLKAAFNHACALSPHERLCAENPLRLLRRLPENNKRDRICTPEELARIIEFGSFRIALASLISFHTGMTQGELCDLKWSDVNETERLFKVHRRKTHHTRFVPYSDRIAAEIVKWANRCPKQSVDPRFLSIDADNFSSQFSRLMKELGIKDLRFHDLRHTALTNMRRKGVDIAVIKSIAGHQSWQMVMRYQTISEDELRKAVNSQE